MDRHFKIDRHFLFLHGDKLVVFTERVLRSLRNHTTLQEPEALISHLQQRCHSLRAVIADQDLKRKVRTEALRGCEAPVYLALAELADHIEQEAQCKADIFTTGFRPQGEQERSRRRGIPTRRRERVTAKLARLSELEVKN